MKNYVKDWIRDWIMACKLIVNILIDLMLHRDYELDDKANELEKRTKRLEKYLMLWISGKEVKPK